MGEIRDMITTLLDVKSEFVDARVIRGSKRSISASAMQGIANFPILIEDSISLEEGGMDICRAVEKNYASFLLTVLTMDPFLEVERGETPTADKYLQQFHQNMRVKNPEKGFHISLADVLKESAAEGLDYELMESEAFRMAYKVYEGVTRSIPQDKNVLLNYTIEDVTTGDVINGLTANVVTEARRNKGGNHGSNGGGGNGGGNNNDGDNNDNVSHIDHADRVVTGDRTIVNNPDTAVNTINNNDFTIRSGDTHNHVKPNITNEIKPTIKNEIKQSAGAAKGSNVRDRGTQWKTLSDNDAKKANDLVPTLLHIRVYPIDRYTREELTPIDFMMGVKATIHPIPLAEIAKMVIGAMHNDNVVFNFFRWTTGEIKFFRDFVFALDSIKMDAANSGKDVSGWGPALRRRRRLSKTKVRLTSKSILPNSTLVVSKEGLDYIRDTYGYDLEDPRIVMILMDKYFLLGFVLLDTVARRVSFRFDGIDTTQIYTLDTLKRENQNDDKAFKNMMKMLGRSM